MDFMDITLEFKKQEQDHSLESFLAYDLTFLNLHF